MSRSQLSRLAGRISLFVAVTATVAPLAAQAPAEMLSTYVITATRTPVDPARLGTAVDAFPAAELARHQIHSLAGALGALPGAPVLASGAPGASASLFLRGANSDQTLFLIDGIRVSDPNTNYQVLLGGAPLGAFDRLEVLRGPQSTLYGGEAVGGVVAVWAQRGEGELVSRVALEAGSFGTIGATASSQGEREPWAYAVSLAAGHTDNDRPNNAFDRAHVTARVDRAVGESVRLGGTVRGFESVFGSPGTIYENDPDNEERESNWLGTLFGEFAPRPDLSARVTVGAQLRRFDSINPEAGGPTQVTVVKNRRAVLDGQATFDGLERHRLTGGITAEANHTRNTGFGDIDERQGLLAVFVQDELTVTESLFITAGLRTDDHDTFGRATTGRVTAAWQVVPDRVKLRASYGTAFRSPGFLDLFGESAFYRGNPALDPEEASGGDIGVDLTLPADRGRISVSGFDTRYRDLIVFDFGVFPGTTANVARARTRGVEVSAKCAVGDAAEVRLSYTYLEADNLTEGVRLLRRPRHSGSLDVWRAFGGGIEAGAGLGLVADREDVHAVTFATIDAEDYVVARLHAAWSPRPQLTVRARVENAFDERYAQVHGFPQPGFGAFLGVESVF